MTGLRVEPAAWDDPEVQRLTAAQQVELRARCATSAVTWPSSSGCTWCRTRAGAEWFCERILSAS